MRPFHAEKQRIPKTEDSLAERDEFELADDFVNGQQGVRERQRVRKWVVAKRLARFMAREFSAR